MGSPARYLVIENMNGLELDRVSREGRRDLETICLLEEKRNPREMRHVERQSR